MKQLRNRNKMVCSLSASVSTWTLIEKRDLMTNLSWRNMWSGRNKDTQYICDLWRCFHS